MLSITCKYAIRAVLYLAENCEGVEKIGIKQISKDLKIPTPFLGKILQTLARHKIITSSKGPHGGFGIEENDVLLMDIVEVIDGKDGFHQCVLGVKYCMEQNNPCAVHSRYAALREEIKSIFESETIGMLISNRKGGKLDYFI